MMRRHLRGPTASTACRVDGVASCVALPRVGVAVDALSGSAVRVPLFVRLSFEIWGCWRRKQSSCVCVAALGGLAQACATSDRRREQRTRCRQPALARLLPAHRRVARHCPRGWHLSAVGANVCCTGATPILPRVSYHLTRPTTTERPRLSIVRCKFGNVLKSKHGLVKQQQRTPADRYRRKTGRQNAIVCKVPYPT